MKSCARMVAARKAAGTENTDRHTEIAPVLLCDNIAAQALLAPKSECKQLSTTHRRRDAVVKFVVHGKV